MKINLDKITKEELLHEIIHMTNMNSHELVSSVAHDVKNPLGIIDLSAGLLEDKIEKALESVDDEKLKKKIRTFIENISIGLEKCEVILDNVLLLKRIDGDYKKVEDVCISELINHYFIFSKPALKSKKMSFECMIEETVNIKLNKKAFLMVLNGALSESVRLINAEAGALAEATIKGNEILITFQTKKEDAPLSIGKITKLSDQLDSSIFHEELIKTGYQFSIEQMDSIIITKIEIPKN